MLYISISNIRGAHFGVEFSQKVEVFLEVGGQYGLDDQEAKAFEVHVVQTGQKIVLRPRHEEIPGRRCVMVLQHRTVIIKHSLQTHTKDFYGNSDVSRPQNNVIIY